MARRPTRLAGMPDDGARHPLDGCMCGDYRRDHKNRTGRCMMPDDLTHGFHACMEFRLSHHARQSDIDREAEIEAALRAAGTKG